MFSVRFFSLIEIFLIGWNIKLTKKEKNKNKG